MYSVDVPETPSTPKPANAGFFYVELGVILLKPDKIAVKVYDVSTVITALVIMIR
jgi:hypothetical protein